MCRRDLLFYVNSFCWTYDPRHVVNPVVPFISWDFQNETMLTLADWIFSQQHGTGKKSRDMGFTWMAVIVSSWLWNFYDSLAILFASRKADYVDKTGDPKTIFWKFDFIVDWLPRFLKPPKVNKKGEDARTFMLYRNYDTGSVVSGESTNEDLSRGDRRTVIWLDEFASVRTADAVMAAALDASGCVIPFSTPRGAATEFARLNKSSKWGFVYLHWSEHPEKARGLYRVKNGEVEIIDREYHNYNPGYEFVYEPGLVDGLRSPWYDEQAETRSKTQLAQEVDGDDAASGSQFFDPVKIIERMDEAGEPVFRGELIYDIETFKPKQKGLYEQRNGRLALWVEYEEGRPQESESYAIGVDVAVGTGASNTVFTVVNRRSGEQEAEFACSTIKPVAAAEYLVALARWYNDAFVVPEANGPGRELVDRITEMGYLQLYFRRKEESLSKKSSDVAGWFSTPASKRSLLAEYGRALETGEVVIRSAESLEECNCYVVTATGVEHEKALSNAKSDPTGAKANHGDRVISAALAWKGVGVFALQDAEPEGEKYPPGTVGYRFYERRRKMEEELTALGAY